MHGIPAGSNALKRSILACVDLHVPQPQEMRRFICVSAGKRKHYPKCCRTEKPICSPKRYILVRRLVKTKFYMKEIIVSAQGIKIDGLALCFLVTKTLLELVTNEF